MKKNRVVSATVSILLFGLTAAARGEEANPPSVTGFEVVTVDLEGQFFTDVLPFDLPFVISGTAPTGINNLQVYCWKLDTRRLDKKGQQKKRGGKLVPVAVTPSLENELVSNCPAWDGAAPSWTNSIAPQTGTPTFRILVPRLEAEEYYSFTFVYDKKVSEADALAFAAKVRKAADDNLWGPTGEDDLPESGDLTNDQLDDLRDELIDALKAVSGPGRIVDCGKARELCKSVPISEVRNDFNSLLLPVRNAQGKVDAALEQYTNDVAALDLQLGRMKAEPLLATAAQRLANAADDQASLQNAAAKLAAAVGLADLPSLDASDRKSAEAVSSFAQTTAEQLGETVETLEDLQAVISEPVAADNPNGPRKASTLLDELVSSSILDQATADAYVALAQPRGAIGTPLRAARRLRNLLTNRISEALDTRNAEMATLQAKYQTRVAGVVTVAGSTTGAYATQQKNYISADTGIAFALDLDEVPKYVGTNFYFRPINKAAPLQQFGNFFQTLDRRLSVTVGLTIDPLSDSKTRDDLFGSQSLVLGLGVRLISSVRLTAGGIVFKEKDPNPLVDDESLTVTPFLSMSFDINVIPSLKGTGKLFQ